MKSTTGILAICSTNMVGTAEFEKKSSTCDEVEER